MSSALNLSANESVAKFSVHFSTVSIKGIMISRIFFFYISLLAGMNLSYKCHFFGYELFIVSFGLLF